MKESRILNKALYADDKFCLAESREDFQQFANRFERVCDRMF